jgi:hypothetical protein
MNELCENGACKTSNESGDPISLKASLAMVSEADIYDGFCFCHQFMSLHCKGSSGKALTPQPS